MFGLHEQTGPFESATGVRNFHQVPAGEHVGRGKSITHDHILTVALKTQSLLWVDVAGATVGAVETVGDAAAVGAVCSSGVGAAGVADATAVLVDVVAGFLATRPVRRTCMEAWKKQPRSKEDSA